MARASKEVRDRCRALNHRGSAATWGDGHCNYLVFTCDYCDNWWEF